MPNIKKTCKRVIIRGSHLERKYPKNKTAVSLKTYKKIFQKFIATV